MIFSYNIIRVSLVVSALGTASLSGQDYFKTYAPKQGLPVKVYYVNNPKPMETRLLSVDDTKGVLKTTQSEYSLRELKTRNSMTSMSMPIAILSQKVVPHNQPKNGFLSPFATPMKIPINPPPRPMAAAPRHFVDKSVFPPEIPIVSSALIRPPLVYAHSQHRIAMP